MLVLVLELTLLVGGRVLGSTGNSEKRTAHREFDQIRTQASTPMQELIPAKTDGEELSNPRENLLSNVVLPTEAVAIFKSLARGSQKPAFKMFGILSDTV